MEDDYIVHRTFFTDNKDIYKKGPYGYGLISLTLRDIHKKTLKPEDYHLSIFTFPKYYFPSPLDFGPVPEVETAQTQPQVAPIQFPM